MQNLGVNVYIEGNLQTQKTIAYTREIDICSGVGTLVLEVDDTITPAIAVGNTIIVYEDGTKVGTFYAGTPNHDVRGSIRIDCQDVSKYLQAHFIHKLYNTGGGTSRYWIGKVLDWAGISYNFTTASNGYVLPPNDKIGLEYGYNVVMQLCQQSGWYFYFDGDGVCQIGELSTSWSSPQFTLSESDEIILSEYLDSDDDMLRNKVVVWGGAVADFQTPYKVYASLEVTTPWDRDANDKRTIVYTNNYIRDRGTAYSLAKKLLDEYSRTVSVKRYELVGAFSDSLGTIGYFDTYIFNGTGMVTSLQASVDSSGGFVTTIFVDERCPRQFGYWSLGSEYVYIGTDGNGVWRKQLDGATWSNWSTGITNLYITDLKIKNGLFACTTNDYRVYYRKIIDSAWTAFSPTGFFDEQGTEYQLTDLLSKGCSINENTGEIIYGFYNKHNTKKSWLVKRSSSGTYTVKLINTDVSNEFQLHDVDTNNTINLVSATKVGTSTNFTPPPDVKATGGFGINYHFWEPTSYTYTMDHMTSPSQINRTDANRFNSQSCYDGKYIYYTTNTDVVQWDIENDTVSTLNVSTTWTYAIGLIVLEEGVVLAVYYDNLAYKAYVFNFNTSSTTLKYTESIDSSVVEVLSNVVVAGFTDESSGDIYACWITNERYYSGLYPYPRLIVHWYNYTSDSTSIETFTPTFDANSYASAPLFYCPTLQYEEEYACACMTVQSLNIGGGNHSHYVYLWTFDLQNQSTALQILEDNAVSPSSPECYFGGYDPNGNQFIFYIASWDSASGSPETLIKVPKAGGSNTVVDVSSETRDIFPFFTDGETLYAKVRQPTSPFEYDIKTIPGFSQIESLGSESRTRIAYHANYREDTGVDYYYIDTSNTLRGSKSGVIKTNVADGTNQLWLSIFGKNMFIFDRSDDEVNVVSSSSDVIGGADRNQALVELQTPVLSASGYNINFQYRNTFSYPLQIEVSRESPIIFFGGTVASGSPVGGIGELWLTTYATSGDWHKAQNTLGAGVTLHGYYPDARIGDVLGLSSTVDGWVYHNPPSGFARYVYTPKPYQSVNYPTGLYYREAYQWFDSWSLFESFPSGTLHKCELSNYRFSSPYTFVSSSGYPSRFWQLDPGYASEFVEYSTGLPNGNITVIRLDDRI